MSVEFVDTNVLVYAHDRDAGRKREIARELVTRLLDDGSFAISVQVLAEFFVVVTRKLPAPLAEKEAAAIVADLSACRVYAPAAADVVAAIGLARAHRLGFWDALIVRAAEALGASKLWTEDLAHGSVIRGVKIAYPF